MNRAPLSGVRVIEIGSMITAPLAASLLAEMGAEVLKVERPEGGDPFRSFMGGLYSPHFRAYNKNKKSIVLDLGTSQGVSDLKALLGTADVLIENFRPGVMGRLGLSVDVIAALNPKLVYCSITGFGTDGPYAHRPAYDTVAQALSGLASVFLDERKPQLGGPTISDNVTGMYAAQGVLAALYERARGGKARRVEVNMLDASIAFIPDSFALSDEGFDLDRLTRVRASQSYAMRCADGGMVAIHLSSPQKFWNALLQAIERPDLASDPRFAERLARFENYEALQETLAGIFLERPRAEWVQRLASRDIPFAPVYNVADVPRDEQVVHQRTFYESAGADGNSYSFIHAPVRFDGERTPPLAAPPLLGQHTGELGRLGSEALPEATS